VSQILNVGLIGQKFMGRAHSNAWSQVPRFFDLELRPGLHTIAARDGGELEALAARWGWARSTTRWQDLAEDPEIDLVDIGTPNDVHAEQAIAMLEAGKHVACEKPLAGTLEDARAMRDAAARGAKARTFVWFNYRRCPALALAWQLVRAGRLGAIRHVRATYLQSWGGPEVPLTWRFQKAAAGSGAHGDLNAHIVDMARFLVGEAVQEVRGAVARTFIEERRLPDGKAMGRSDVDDALLFLATFEGGATASFEATRLAHGHENRNTIELNGERGSLRFDFESMNELGFFDAEDGAREQGWKRIVCTSAAGKHPYAANWWPDAHVLGYEHGFVNMAADILASLSGGEPVVPLPDFADAFETQRVLEAALLSAREGCAVPLAEVR
jgi:predicted dehydrogenase